MAPNKQKQKQKQLQAKKKAYNNRNQKSSNKSTWIAIGVIAILVIVFAAVAASGILGNNGANSPTATPTPSPIPAAADPYANASQVLLQTSMGDIIVELRNDMPITTTNFINCVNQGVYNGSTFHRVIEDFMIQGGEPANNQVVTPIQDERTTTNHNYNGTIAMAKTDNPNSATSGFFINTADNSQIIYPTGVKFDDTYSAFGRVTYGMDVAMAISHVATNSSDAPTSTVTILGAAVVA